MDVYARLGPPPFMSMAALAGFKPKAKPVRIDDYDGPENLASFLAAFPGGYLAPPPPEPGADADG